MRSNWRTTQKSQLTDSTELYNQLTSYGSNTVVDLFFLHALCTCSLTLWICILSLLYYFQFFWLTSTLTISWKSDLLAILSRNPLHLHALRVNPLTPPTNQPVAMKMCISFFFISGFVWYLTSKSLNLHLEIFDVLRSYVSKTWKAYKVLLTLHDLNIEI